LNGGYLGLKGSALNIYTSPAIRGKKNAQADGQFAKSCKPKKGFNVSQGIFGFATIG